MNFYIEMTDTFGGEANYSWVRRYRTNAKTIRGAINKLAKQYGAGWRLDYDDGETACYQLQNACICCFVSVANEYTPDCATI